MGLRSVSGGLSGSLKDIDLSVPTVLLLLDPCGLDLATAVTELKSRSPLVRQLLILLGDDKGLTGAEIELAQELSLEARRQKTFHSCLFIRACSFN